MFTDEYIDNLEPAEIVDGMYEQQTNYFDEYNIGEGGRLGIRVRLHDPQKDWFLEYQFRDTLRHLVLGHYPKISLSVARKLAAARLSEVD